MGSKIVKLGSKIVKLGSKIVKLGSKIVKNCLRCVLKKYPLQTAVCSPKLENNGFLRE